MYSHYRSPWPVRLSDLLSLLFCTSFSPQPVKSDHSTLQALHRVCSHWGSFSVTSRLFWSDLLVFALIVQSTLKGLWMRFSTSAQIKVDWSKLINIIWHEAKPFLQPKGNHAPRSSVLGPFPLFSGQFTYTHLSKPVGPPIFGEDFQKLWWQRSGNIRWHWIRYYLLTSATKGLENMHEELENSSVIHYRFSLTRMEESLGQLKQTPNASFKRSWSTGVKDTGMST